jgi:predicted O-methyltransferase YrrM
MFFTVFGDQIIKGASRDHKNDPDQYDEIFVDLVKKRIAYAKLNELLSRNTDLELFIVDNVFTAGTDSQTVGY